MRPAFSGSRNDFATDRPALVQLAARGAPAWRSRRELRGPGDRWRASCGVAALVAATALLSACATAPEAKGVEEKLAALAWLEGTWTCESASGEVVEECWGSARGGWMLGVARTLRVEAAGERVVAFEYLRIEQRAGELIYVAQPGGRAPGTEFRLVEHVGDAWSFENPAHDFPDRIRYQRRGSASFTATISGSEGGQPLQFALEYRRASR